MGSDRFIACGMYAFNDDLRHAWQRLFEGCRRLFEDECGDYRLRFETGPADLLDEAMCFGHTCGYPLVTQFSQHLDPFCVPLFDVPGCDGKLYSSVLITGVDSDIADLSDCRDRVVAINTVDSNSGMNVLRHALAVSGVQGQFFRRVMLTGGHQQSLSAVAEGAAQLAAIDCVSYQLIKDQSPDLVQRVRPIGNSAHTCGLPFVVSKRQAVKSDFSDWIDGLNRALVELPEVSKRLHLTGFSAVNLDDYHSILQLETDAIDAGYPSLK